MYKEIEINEAYYTVYDNGDVFGRDKKIKQRPNSDGYACFTAGRKLHRTSVKTHSIVAKLFVPNPNGYNEVDHLDGNRMNADYRNLEWVTHKENIKRAKNKGSYEGRIVGESNPKAKLTKEIILQIRNDFKNGEKQSEIAKKYCVPYSTIHNIVTRNTWKNI